MVFLKIDLGTNMHVRINLNIHLYLWKGEKRSYHISPALEKTIAILWNESILLIDLAPAGDF